LFTDYVALVEGQGSPLNPSAAGSPIFIGIKWEVFQQHRRVQNGLTPPLEPAEAVRLEAEVLEVLGLWREQDVVRQVNIQGSKLGDQPLEYLLKEVLQAFNPATRREALETHLYRLYQGFEASASTEDVFTRDPTTSDPLTTCLRDLCALNPSYNLDDLSALIRRLQRNFSSSAEWESSAAGQFLGSLYQSRSGKILGDSPPEKPQTGSPQSLGESHVKELMRILDSLMMAKQSSLDASIASASGDRQIERYLVLLYGSCLVEGFLRQGQVVWNEVSSHLARTLASLPSSAMTTIGTMVAASVFRGQDCSNLELTQLTKRSSDWVEKELLGKVEAVKRQAQRQAVLDGQVTELVAVQLEKDLAKSGLSPDKVRRFRGQLRNALAKVDATFLHSMEEEIKLPLKPNVLQRVFKQALGRGARGNDHVDDAAYTTAFQQKVFRAKELLDFLRNEEEYMAYVARVEDEVVEEIEEELLDHIYEMSEELRTSLDPDMVESKVPKHYDVPSLRFRVLNDSEAGGIGLEQESGRISEAFSATLATDADHGTREGLNCLRTGLLDGTEARWRFAFKPVKRGGQTMVQDAVAGALRPASSSEAQSRSWQSHPPRQSWDECR
jgi:hypothetical protein